MSWFLDVSSKRLGRRRVYEKEKAFVQEKRKMEMIKRNDFSFAMCCTILSTHICLPQNI